MGLGNIGILYVNVWWIMHLLKKLEDLLLVEFLVFCILKNNAVHC
jgi:hypothetical protein